MATITAFGNIFVLIVGLLAHVVFLNISGQAAFTLHFIRQEYVILFADAGANTSFRVPDRPFWAFAGVGDGIIRQAFGAL